MKKVTTTMHVTGQGEPKKRTPLTLVAMIIVTIIAYEAIMAWLLLLPINILEGSPILEILELLPYPIVMPVLLSIANPVYLLPFGLFAVLLTATHLWLPRFNNGAVGALVAALAAAVSMGVAVLVAQSSPESAEAFAWTHFVPAIAIARFAVAAALASWLFRRRRVAQTSESPQPESQVTASP